MFRICSLSYHVVRLWSIFDPKYTCWVRDYKCKEFKFRQLYLQKSTEKRIHLHSRRIESIPRHSKDVLTLLNLYFLFWVLFISSDSVWSTQNSRWIYSYRKWLSLILSTQSQPISVRANIYRLYCILEMAAIIEYWLKKT